MKNIFKFLPALALALCFVSCEDLTDDKATIDAKYAVEAPTLQLSGLKAEDYATVSYNFTISSIDGLYCMGLEVADNASFNNSELFELEDLTKTSGSAVATGLAPDTKYFARLCAYTPDNMSVSDVMEVTTPSVPLTASLLEGKTYKGTIADYWGDEYDFNVTFVADAEDPYKVTVCDIEPYLASKGYVAAKGYNKFEGVLDPETGIISVAIGQKIGYKDYYLVAFDANSIDDAEGYAPLQIQVVNYGASVTFLNGYGFTNGGGWWEIFDAPFTLK